MRSYGLTAFLAAGRLYFKNPRLLYLYKGILKSKIIKIIISHGCGVAHLPTDYLGVGRRFYVRVCFIILSNYSND